MHQHGKNTVLVPSSVRGANVIPTAVCTTARSTIRSSRIQTPYMYYSSKQETNVIGLESYRKSLEMEVISSNAAKLIFQSRRLGSIACYKLAWNKWTSSCVREKSDPFWVPLSKLVDYLSTLFDEALQYFTISQFY